MSTQTLSDKKLGQGSNSVRANGDGFRLFRETLESLAVALVLALLFKTFLIELFVIPTGSMAPTLMGFHKDVVCPQCKTRYKVNASEEFPEATGHGVSSSDESKNARVLGGTCPQCGATAYLGKDNVDNVDYRSYSGDRILVAKYNYLFRQPKRWHVTVFRYPAKPQVSYIKRLVGLENETVRIQHGDIFVRKNGETDFVIQRKPLRELNSMLQLVHDTEHTVPEWESLGYPSAWQAEDNGSGASIYKNKTFSVNTTKTIAETSWIYYHHIIPSSEECLKLETGALPPTAVTAKPMLITDFTPYNSGLVRNSQGMRRQASDFITVSERHDGKNVVRDYQCYRDPDYMGLNWVGDLAVSFDFTVEKSTLFDSNLFVKLVKGGVTFVCKIDLQTGDAELSVEGMEDAFEPVYGKTNVRNFRGENSHRIMFMNIDEELRLSVDGNEVTFDRPARYDSLIDVDNRMRRDRSPTELDLRPISIGVRGAEATITKMKVQRDLYYLAANDSDRGWMCDLVNSPFASYFGDSEQQNRNILSSTEFFKYFGKTKQVDFEVGRDEFLMLGDNSPMSKDSRLWTSDFIPGTRDYIPAPVPRELLVGEALFVYWPHGLPLPFVPLNIIPNVKQMRLID